MSEKVDVLKGTSMFKQGEKVTIRVLSPLWAQATGVYRIVFAHPRYRLEYLDGAWEEAECPMINTRHGDFDIIGAVQHIARNEDL
jgi:hypothetical protein